MTPTFIKIASEPVLQAILRDQETSRRPVRKNWRAAGAEFACFVYNKVFY
jgi:hypothetical protein